MTPNHLHYWLATIHIPNATPQKIMRCVSHFGSIEALFNAPTEELQEAGLKPDFIAALKSPDWKSVEEDLMWEKAEDHHLITGDDSDYPPRLKEISDPPLVLYVKGNKSTLLQSQLAMVGARNATPTGQRTAENFACTLAEAGLVITSGLALGIDGASHRGALKAKGKTIAVFGTGLQHIYPTSHRKLAEEIIQQQGALISEFPLNTSPTPYHFPRRNRIISGLSLGVLVVEAKLKSGSLVTVKHALDQGREVFAIPGSIHHPLAKGCNHLIRQGAKLVETAEDILEEFGFALPEVKNAQKVVELPTEQALIYAQIDTEITPMEVILCRTGLTAGDVSSILLVLELDGFIQSVPGGYIRT